MAATTEKRPFIDALVTLQKRSGKSGRAFAEVLGISHSEWSRVLSGDRQVGLYLVRKAVRVYPELALHAGALFLESELPSSTPRRANKQSRVGR